MILKKGYQDNDFNIVSLLPDGSQPENTTCRVA